MTNDRMIERVCLFLVIVGMGILLFAGLNLLWDKSIEPILEQILRAMLVK